MANTGRINGWLCDECGRVTYAIHVDDGVTPMFLACRAEGVDPREAACKGQATSLMYPSAPPPKHVVEDVRWEWYRPDRAELVEMDRASFEHVQRGGLLLRVLTDAGRRALAVVGTT